MAVIMACALLCVLGFCFALYMGIEIVRPLSMPAPLENEPSLEMLDLYYELSSEDVDVSEYDCDELSVTETICLMAETLPFEAVVEMGFSFELDRSTFVVRLPDEHPWVTA